MYRFLTTTLRADRCAVMRCTSGLRFASTVGGNGGLPFTNASMELLADARGLAHDHGHVSLTPLHIGTKLVEGPSSDLTTAVLKKVGADSTRLRNLLHANLSRLPRQRPPPPLVSIVSDRRALPRVAQHAQRGKRHTPPAATNRPSPHPHHAARIPCSNPTARRSTC